MINKELYRNPLTMQTFKLQELLIKEQKNKYKYIIISFIAGLSISLITTLLSYKINQHQKEINELEIYNTVNHQRDLIESLKNDNTNLILILKDLRMNLDSLK